jgi:hypothetical protein
MGRLARVASRHSFFNHFDVSSEATRARNVGGRPLKPDDPTLFTRCDTWILLLSRAWGDIGWWLLTARDEQDIRNAFARVKHPAPPEEPLLRPLLHMPSGRVSAEQLRDRQQALETLRANQAECIYDNEGRAKLPMLAQEMFESKRALREASSSLDKTYESIRQAHLRRVTALVSHKREFAEFQKKVDALDAQTRDEEAAYTQSELLAFIRVHKYKFTIRNVACALAGLPLVGASQSHRRCAQHKDIYWPTFQSKIFDVIDRAWRGRTDRSPERFQLELQKQICRMRTRDRQGNDDRQAKYAQDRLTEKWRYVKLAIQHVDLTTAAPKSVPFFVLGEFQNRSQEAEGSEKERVQASIEKLDCTHRRHASLI